MRSKLVKVCFRSIDDTTAADDISTGDDPTVGERESRNGVASDLDQVSPPSVIPSASMHNFLPQAHMNTPHQSTVSFINICICRLINVCILMWREPLHFA